VYKALVFTRGEIRVMHILFELDVPYVVMDDGSRFPLDPRWLHHIEQAQPQLWYQYEVLPP
jgi:hypothetical protein